MNPMRLGFLLSLLVGNAGVVSAAVTTVINGGSVTINPSSRSPLRRSGRVFRRGTTPYYISGVGGPENFAFLADTRKQLVINDLKTYGVNGIYFHALRAFGGDGGADEHLFFSATDKRLDPAKLNALARFMDQLDQAGIVMWFNTLDDHAKPWGCITDANAADYTAYARDLALVFRGYKHLIWVTQEEYNWLTNQAGCDANANVRLQRTLSQALRANDATHAIAVHHMRGQAFAFGGDPIVGVFGQQSLVKTVDEMHETSGLQGWNSGVAYVQSEAYTWHGDLITADDVQSMRRSLWATAFSGGSVFVWGAYEVKDPTAAMLEAIGGLSRFMNTVQYNVMIPLFGTSLAGRLAGGTKWILKLDNLGVYLLYGLDAAALGIKRVAAGSYSVQWYDAVAGSTIAGDTITHAGGTLVLAKPAAIGAEAVLYLVRQASTV